MEGASEGSPSDFGVRAVLKENFGGVELFFADGEGEGGLFVVVDFVEEFGFGGGEVFNDSKFFFEGGNVKQVTLEGVFELDERVGRD